MKRLRPTACQHGFSLVEVLVAFVIASGSIGLIYDIQRNSQRMVLGSGEYTLAMELARSLLVESTAYLQESAGLRTGSYGSKYEWTMTLAPYDSSPSETGSDVLPLTEVQVVVAWRSGAAERQVLVKTLRPTAQTGLDQGESRGISL